MIYRDVTSYIPIFVDLFGAPEQRLRSSAPNPCNIHRIRGAFTESVQHSQNPRSIHRSNAASTESVQHYQNPCNISDNMFHLCSPSVFTLNYTDKNLYYTGRFIKNSLFYEKQENYISAHLNKNKVLAQLTSLIYFFVPGKST